MNINELRERIEASLRGRCPDARLSKYPTEHHRALWVAKWRGGDASQRAYTADTATPDADVLAALAVALGLDEDGTDPRARVEQLRAVAQAAAALVLWHDAHTPDGDLQDADGHFWTMIDALRAAGYELPTGTPTGPTRNEMATDLAAMRARAEAAERERDAALAARDEVISEWLADTSDQAVASHVQTIASMRSNLDGLRAGVQRADDECAALRERVATVERERDTAYLGAAAIARGVSASDLDLDAIEMKARRDVVRCDECETFVAKVCGNRECGARRCDAHATPSGVICTHAWLPADAGSAATILALVRKVRDLAALRDFYIADSKAARAMLSRVVRHESTGSHGHDVCGRWDASNGPLGHGGLPCARCHTFADARTMLGADRWPTRQDVLETYEVCERLEPCPCDDVACGCGTKRPWGVPVINKVPGAP